MRSVTAVCTNASRMGVARSWADWRGGNGLDVVEPQHAKTIKRVANPRLESGWNVSRALGCTTTAESDGNEGT